MMVSCSIVYHIIPYYGMLYHIISQYVAVYHSLIYQLVLGYIELIVYVVSHSIVLLGLSVWLPVACPPTSQRSGGATCLKLLI